MMEKKDQSIKKNDGSEELNIIKEFSEREQSESEFSLAKGAALGIVGKVAGTAVVTTAQEGLKNKLKNELLGDPKIKEALNHATNPAESEAVIKNAMQNAIEHMEGLSGNLLRNKWAWKIGGGAAVGLGMLGWEYASHLRNKEKTDKNIQDLKKLEDSWTKHISREQQNDPTRER